MSFSGRGRGRGAPISPERNDDNQNYQSPGNVRFGRGAAKKVFSTEIQNAGSSNRGKDLPVRGFGRGGARHSQPERHNIGDNFSQTNLARENFNDRPTRNFGRGGSRGSQDDRSNSFGGPPLEYPDFTGNFARGDKKESYTPQTNRNGPTNNESGYLRRGGNP